MAMMTLVGYAMHRGVFPHAVEVAIATGRIRRGLDGMIDSESADKDWEANTNPVRAAASKENGQQTQAIRRARGNAPSRDRKPAQSASGAAAAPQGTTDISTYAAARAAREQYTAEIRRIELLEKQGAVVRKDLVIAEAEHTGRQLREAFANLPDRVAEELAGETDASVIRRRLGEEIRDILSRLAGPDMARRAVGG